MSLECKSVLSEWLVDVLTCGENKLCLPILFKDKSEVLTYFKINNLDSLSYAFSDHTTKTSKKLYEKKFKGLELDILEVGILAAKDLNGKVLIESDIEIIAYLLSPLFTSHKSVLNYLTEYSFGYVKKQHDYSQYFNDSDCNKGDLIFAGNIFEYCDQVVLHEFLNDRLSDVFKKHSRFIYQKSLELGCYTFQPIDIEYFNSNLISMDSIWSRCFGYRNKSDDKERQQQDSIVAAVINLHEQKQITLSQVKSFLRPHGNYRDLVSSFPRLAYSRGVLACIAFEELKGQKYKMPSYSSISEYKENVHHSAFHDLYGHQDLAGIALTYMSTQLKNHNNPYIVSDYNPYRVEAKSMTKSEVDLFNEMESVKEYLCSDIAKIPSELKSIGLSFIIQRLRFTIAPVLSYPEVESCDWWDHGSKTVYDSLLLHTDDSIKSILRKPEYITYTQCLEQALQFKSYFLIASQSVLINELSRAKFNLGRIEEIFIQSLHQLSSEDLQKLPIKFKISASYLACKSDIDLTKKIISSFNKSDYKSCTPPLLTLDDISLFSRCLTNQCDLESNDIYQLQDSVIGRVSRDITEYSGIFALCITTMIRESVILKNVSCEEIKDVVEEGDQCIGHYSEDPAREFSRKHFPRLKNFLASEKECALITYIKAKNLINEACKEDGLMEGLFVKDDTLYVIGEFIWTEILTPEFIDDGIAKITFLTVVCQNDEAVSIKQTTISISKESLSLLLTLYHAYTGFSYSIYDELENRNVSQLDLVNQYYLPTIAFNGMVYNNI